MFAFDLYTPDAPPATPATLPPAPALLPPTGVDLLPLTVVGLVAVAVILVCLVALNVASRGGRVSVRGLLGWCGFAAGVVFVTVDIVRLNITGLFLGGVISLAFWVWAVGGFRRGFWVSDDPRLGAVDHDLEEQGR
jgi:hypothetical protein